ncbi:MAG: efflux RND transporter periplasmic adaptor subunit [Candidatus Acidiferrales bacterium]
MRPRHKSYWRKHAREFCLLFFTAGFLAGCNSAGKAAANDTANAPHVAVAKVTRQDLSSTLNIASEFLPNQEVTVYAKVSGYIRKLDVNWGTRVRQGQLLAVLDIPELQQQVQQDEAAARRSEQDVSRAKEELSRAESVYNVAHLTYSRLTDVQKTRPELVAQQEIDVAQGKDLEASAGVSSAKDSLAASDEALIGAKAALERDKAMYSYSRITAPFDGVVTEIDAYTGALLPAGTSSNKGDQALCHLAEDRVLRLVIPVPESAVPDIRSGTSVEVRVPVLTKVFQGIVARVSDQVDLSTRTMHAEIDVPNANFVIVPGMYAEASLVLKEKHGALAVPVQALDRQEGRVTVFAVDKSNKIEERQVQTGIETPNLVEVVSGLDENDLVVVGNRSQLRTGTTIQPKLVSSGLTGGGT